MIHILKWLERLSLDAVLVALVWGVAIAKLADRSNYVWDLILLGSATWLTYVADRLWEVRSEKSIPETDRHLYHKNNYMRFLYTWLAGFVVSIILAVLFLPDWKMMWGWCLVGTIAVYFWVLDRISDSSRKLLLKKIIVPMVFAAGVVWMAEGWRSIEGIAGSVVLLAAALSNVLLISYWKDHDKDEIGWLERACVLSLILLLACFNAALFVYWPVGVAGLLCAAGYFFLFMKIKTSSASYVRAWVDGILVVAGVSVIVLNL